MRKPAIGSDSLLNNSVAAFVTSKVRKSLAKSNKYIYNVLHNYNILSAIAAHASASANAW